MDKDAGLNRPAGFSRWLAFCATLFLAPLAVFAIWTGGFTAEMIKATLSFAILAAAAYVVHRLARSAPRS